MIARALAVVFAALFGIILAAQGRAAELKIGITQFPSTLNPHIDSMLAKSYVLAMTQRPVTTYDQQWNLICLLCVELPTLENGGAKLETQADGRPGIAVTYRINPKATWGDGTPVTSADMVFTWEAGRHPKSGFGNFDLRDKNQRPGRNPKTGEEIPISARRVVTFRPGQKLKARVEAYAGSK